MKILLLADEELPGLWDYFQKEKVDGVDLILSCGDLRAEYLEFLVTMAHCPLLYVHGNHDGAYSRHAPEGCVDIDGRLYDFRGLRILGLGGSRQKFLYLPEEHNDYIFSIVCEELGFIGAALILILFALLIVRGFWLAMHCRDRYSFLVCAGITALLAFQVILNVAVVTNLLPCTGISLPFFSYGGTALLIQLAEMGIILSISRDIPEKRFIPKRNQSEKTEQSA